MEHPNEQVSCNYRFYRRFYSSTKIEQLGIEVIPMEFLIDDKTYLNYPDGREMTNEQFTKL